MYTIDITNIKGRPERVYVDHDRLIRDEALNKFEKEQLIERFNKDRKYELSNKPIIHVEPQVVMKERIYKLSFDLNEVKVEPVYKRKTSSNFVVYSDGTYDYNEVVSQDYNEKYFDFTEYKLALNK